MFKFSRILVAYIIAAFAALILAYSITTPNLYTVAVSAVIISTLILPIFIKWHHSLLIIFWNSAFIAAFLPGSPDFWLLLSAISFGIAVLNHIMFQKSFLRAPELTIPVLFLAAVVAGTAWYRGGIGILIFGGSTIGGRYYIFIFMAIIGYFALTAQPIAALNRTSLGKWFFLSGATSVLSNVVFMMGSAAYVLYYFIPTGAAVYQATAEATGTAGELERIGGLGAASIAVLCFLLANYGLKGLFDFTKPWRLLFLLLTIAGGCLAGFRSDLLLILMILTIQFCFEGLLRTHYLPLIVGLAILGFASVFVLSSKLPGSIQRSISFLPVKVDSAVREDAAESTQWRLDMWSAALKEVPKYLVIGKGYGMDATEVYLILQAQRLGLIGLSPFEGFLLSGDYHSGPLSVIIPFGIPGAVAFLWLLIAGGRVLYLNYRYGDLELRKLNTVLLSYYISYCISFFFIFGALNTELYLFLGACGLSVSLNGGVRRKAAYRPRKIAAPQTLAMEHSRC